MEERNGIWKKILAWNGIRNGKFLAWNGYGMEEILKYGIWKNRLPFHSMPCLQYLFICLFSSFLSHLRKCPTPVCDEWMQIMQGLQTDWGKKLTRMKYRFTLDYLGSAAI